MFTNGSTLFNDVFAVNVTGYQLKVWFLAISALLCELLASFTLFLVAAMGGKNFHAVELVSVKSMPLANAPESMTIANDSDNKKKVGASYNCESCGSEYNARTVWQKYCPTCSSERKKGVLLAKSRKAKVG